MYKMQSRQHSFLDFDMPLGLSMNKDNRWIKKATLIPWSNLEKEYAELFSESKTGNVALPFRLLFGAFIIKLSRQISDEEVVLQIQESPYLQYFCGLPGYTDEAPFNPSSLTYFRDRLPVSLINALNELMIQHFIEKKAEAEAKKIALKPKSKKDKDLPPKNDSDQNNTTSLSEQHQSSDTPKPLPNKGTMIIDSSCAEQNIEYPTDISLLNKGRMKLERMIDKLHNPKEGVKPRTNRKIARKAFLKVAKKKRRTEEELREGICIQLEFIQNDIKIVEKYLCSGKTLPERDMKFFQVIKKLYEQQLYMQENQTKSIPGRIVSISQPYVHPIMRGKAGAKYEFGAQFCISVIDGITRLEKVSFDPYNEGVNLNMYLDNHFQRHGYYPEKVIVDAIYRNRDNLMLCKKLGIEMNGPKLGRPPKDYVPDKKLIRQDEINRIEVERKLSYSKGFCGLDLITTRKENTSLVTIGMALLTMNLKYFLRVFCFIFSLLQKEKNNLVLCVC